VTAVHISGFCYSYTFPVLFSPVSQNYFECII